MTAKAEGSLFDTYRVLRTMNPSPYMFYFSSDDIEVAGASPETLAKMVDGRVLTFPLAGTRPRGKTKEEDLALEEELLSDEKELSEHNMLVDLGRNDIGKISRPGTVRVEKYLGIERFSHVMHIGSTVAGQIRGDRDSVDVVDAVLPAGTLSGAPKIRACQIIAELEEQKRGIYGGAVGYLDFTGNVDTCISIRLAWKKNGRVCVQSGAGIVADSIPEKEFEECLNKAGAVLQAVRTAQGRAQMILLIDNYDSFVYNLYQFIAETGQQVKTVRNDRITPEEVLEMRPDAVVISPGPGKPADAGICEELIRKAAGKIPLLGVCLGHQAIAEAFGAEVIHAGRLMHGKTSILTDVQESVLFEGLREPIRVARYHSLAVRADTIPEEIRVTAWSEDGEVMAIEHRQYPVYGIQFHPESVMTPEGHRMIENFVRSVTTGQEPMRGTGRRNQNYNHEINPKNRRQNIMIRAAIIKLSQKQDLTYEEAEQVMNEIMEGQATDVQKSSYLTALSMKGETIDEITASAAGMRAHCIKLLHNMDVLEIVGTGGDGANSFNISTTSAMVIAAAGVPVAKHGNRAASSKSGAADVLEALGVKIDLPPERSAELLKEIQICFLFAQNYHIAMKYVAPIRKELGIRTVFNILGPLSNPAGANMS